MTLSERSRSLGEGGHSPVAGRRRLYDSPIFTRSAQGGCVDSRPRARLADETQFDSKPQSLTPFSPPEEAFGLKISDGDIEHIRRVKDVTAYVAAWVDKKPKS
jgi:hypothetical protein